MTGDPDPMKLLVATRSTGKRPEIRRILNAVPGLQVVFPDEVGLQWEPVEEELEPHETFEENAVSKARYFARRSGLPTVADDSGIEVDVLDGAPGVRTKRFAQDGGMGAEQLEGQALDDANNAHLVARLAGVPEAERTARYVCVAAFVTSPDGDATLCRGEAAGWIVDEPRGSGGFGYDPHVFDPALGKTFAEMTPAEKDARSHRGAAFRALATTLGASA